MATSQEDQQTAVTPWFQGTEYPVRPGVYQRQYNYGKTPSVQYCFWNGKGWAMGEHTVGQAMRHKDAFMVAPRQQLPWRGVLSESHSGI